MEKGQKELIIKLVAAVAWADGSISESEKEHLAETVEKLGGLEHKDVLALIDASKDIKPLLPEVRQLPIPVISDVMNFAYRMAVKDNGILEEELAVLKEIALQIWPDHKANLALRWLKNVYEAEEAYLELFVMHFKDA